MTSMISIIADFSALGLEIALDSGLNGDLVTRDNIWTTEIIHNGLQYGVIEIPAITRYMDHCNSNIANCSQ